MADLYIGNAAIDRASTVMSGYTEVDKNTPANLNGTVNRVDIYAVAGYDMANVEIGIFTAVGNVLTTRSVSGNLGTVIGGGVVTFIVNLPVLIGDYIGAYWTAGRIEMATAASTGDWRYPGDQIPCTNATFELYANRMMSLCGYFVAAGIKWNGVTITKWNGQVITKLNGLP